MGLGRIVVEDWIFDEIAYETSHRSRGLEQSHSGIENVGPEGLEFGPRDALRKDPVVHMILDDGDGLKSFKMLWEMESCVVSRKRHLIGLGIYILMSSNDCVRVASRSVFARRT